MRTALTHVCACSCVCWCVYVVAGGRRGGTRMRGKRLGIKGRGCDLCPCKHVAGKGDVDASSASVDVWICAKEEHDPISFAVVQPRIIVHFGVCCLVHACCSISLHIRRSGDAHTRRVDRGASVTASNTFIVNEPFPGQLKILALQLSSNVLCERRLNNRRTRFLFFTSRIECAVRTRSLYWS